MLMLLFYAGEERYACSCEAIVEILPHISLKPIPYAPDFVRGSFNYGGMPIAVVDWCSLMVQRPSESALHSRIILLKFSGKEGKARYLGLMAEKITQTIDRRMEQFVDSGIRLEELPYLTGVHADRLGSIQYVEIESLCREMEEAVFT